MKNSLLISTITFLSLSVIMFSTSCKNKYAVEDAKLDTLEMHLQSAADFLNVDPELIKARVDEIDRNIRRIKQHLKDTVDLEYGMQMDKYKAILKIYKKSLESYSHWTTELEELKKQLSTLRQSLHNNELSREEFKTYYFQEEQDILMLRDGAKSLQRSLYEVEPDYIRLSRFADEQIALLDSMGMGE